MVKVSSHNVRSNLCTKYYASKNRFCGNYCSRKEDRFNRRCWRHSRGRYSASHPPLVLLMISSSDQIFNRDLWVDFFIKCELCSVPIEFFMYHENMNNCTVRDPHNFITRFRPFPDIFGGTLPLRNMHGSVNFAQICLRMLDYGCKVPHAGKCIILTERTVPIREPLEVYKRALVSKCHIDISYNVGYDRVPRGLPSGPRGKPYAGVNNLCQGLYTTEFLKIALPTVPRQCEKFGLTLRNNVYAISNAALFKQWEDFTASKPCEFWLLNSFILDSKSERPMQNLKQFMEITQESDKYTVAEVPEYRDGLKRTFVFRDKTKRYILPDRNNPYYRGLDLDTGVTFENITRFIRSNKRMALFFRQVELP